MTLDRDALWNVYMKALNSNLDGSEAFNALLDDIERQMSSATGQTELATQGDSRSLPIGPARSAEPQETPRTDAVWNGEYESNAEMGSEARMLSEQLERELSQANDFIVDLQGRIRAMWEYERSQAKELSQAREQIVAVATAGSASEERAERAEQQLAEYRKALVALNEAWILSSRPTDSAKVSEARHKAQLLAASR